MTYDKCLSCEHRGGTCHKIMTSGACAVAALEDIINRGLYNNLKNTNESQIVEANIDINCLGFKDKGSDSICGRKFVEVKETPYDYSHLRLVIHEYLCDFYHRELDCANGNEFDYEYMEFITDSILRLIRRQGGQV